MTEGGPLSLPGCEEAGSRRLPTAAEMAQYCLCTAIGEDNLAWECYGPPSTAAKPQATCGYTTVSPGTGHGSCLVTWEKCSNGQVYGISCVDNYCECLVQGIVTALLAPMETCPEDKPALNMLCGWDLQ